MALGQAPGAPNPAPKAGIMIERVQGNGGPELKFSNSTDKVLGFVYGNNVFIIKPGQSKSIAIPKEKLVFLTISEKSLADERIIIIKRFEGKVSTNTQKRFIPLPVEEE
jgi:hypothetical protein